MKAKGVCRRWSEYKPKQREVCCVKKVWMKRARKGIWCDNKVVSGGGQGMFRGRTRNCMKDGQYL